MTAGRRIVALRWLERTLLGAGLALAVWCTAVLIEAERIKNLPVPSARAAAPGSRLPGEGESGGAAPVGAWVARLEIPSLSMTATVLEGTDDGTLRRAAGHIGSTAPPGPYGNVGIAGHRDTIFRPLRKLQIGERVLVTTTDKVLEYRVTTISVVNPEDVYVLDPTSEPRLTLVTCYPFTFLGSAPQRLIVRADLAGMRERP